jgi:plastocyanin
MNSRRLACFFLALAFGPGLAPAGTIIGTVRAEGPAEVEGAGADGNYGSRRFKFLERVDYDAMRDFVVHIDRVSAPASADDPPIATIRQRDGLFVPRVLPVVAGTEVEWPNEDDIFHNVFSVSEICSFDLGVYKRGAKAQRTRFPLPGRVDVFCSIHTRMSCIVLVLPNPWFAATDTRNHYRIADVPAGTYRLRAWHERLPAQAQEVVVPETGTVEVDFILGPGRPTTP